MLFRDFNFRNGVNKLGDFKKNYYSIWSKHSFKHEKGNNMLCLFNHQYINRVLLVSLLLTFPMSITVPVHSANFIEFQYMGVTAKLTTLLNKLQKSRKKETCIKNLLEIKKEIETSYGIKLNISQSLKQVQKQFKENGSTLSNSQRDSIEKLIKKQDKHPNNKTSKEDDQKQQEEIPSQLVYGVVISLCGVFLYALPIQCCKDWGARLIMAGLSSCAPVLCSKNDEKNKEKKRNENEL